MEASSRLRLNTDEVAAKVIDGEAIVMNLVNGMYYSMDGVAGRMWEGFQAGYTIDDVARMIAHDYGVGEADARRDALGLASELVTERIVVLDDGDVAAPRWQPYGTAAPNAAYEPPALNRYGDMADLLALDPPLPGVAQAAWAEAPADPPNGGATP